MSEEVQEKAKSTLKTACIQAVISSFILIVVTCVAGFFMYQYWVKPELEKLPINVEDVKEAYNEYQEMKVFLDEYETLYKQYLNEKNWEKLDELNRKKDQYTAEMDQLKKILEMFNYDTGEDVSF
jgi:hypothetical protein